MQDIISININENLDFGCHELDHKSKEIIEYRGLNVKVKTHSEITRLERDELMIYESVPGTTVTDFSYRPEKISFNVTGMGNTSIIIAVNQNNKYRLMIDDEQYFATNVLSGGKIQFIIDFNLKDWIKVDLIKEN